MAYNHISVQERGESFVEAHRFSYRAASSLHRPSCIVCANSPLCRYWPSNTNNQLSWACGVHRVLFASQKVAEVATGTRKTTHRHLGRGALDTCLVAVKTLEFRIGGHGKIDHTAIYINQGPMDTQTTIILHRLHRFCLPAKTWSCLVYFYTTLI